MQFLFFYVCVIADVLHHSIICSIICAITALYVSIEGILRESVATAALTICSAAARYDTFHLHQSFT